MKKVYIICLAFILVVVFVISAAVISINKLSTEKTRNSYIASAQKNLEILRRGTSDPFSYMYSLKHYIKEGNLSFDEVGTDEEELEELRIKGCKSSAEFYLSYLRKGSPDYKICFEMINMGLKDGSLSLNDIGTDEKELEELRIKGCKASAEKYLSFLRNSSIQYKYWVERIREELKKGNFSLADIGTDEEEIRSFAPKPKFDPKMMAKTPCFLQQGVLFTSPSALI